MKTYVVGGAVRDRLLGLPIIDRDHVVVGATVDEMRAAGFKPVGKDFPVFLHPITHEEYALARTERKTAPGYAGFVFHADPSVTLEDDLARRDLTINAMAEDETGALIDPFGGAADLAARRFRHVGPAFAEDPVRILRVARFAARFVDFDVDADTRRLMAAMVDGGEADALVPERVWQEWSRGLMEARPSRMLDVLSACGALARILPELDASFARAADALRRVVDLAAARDAPLPVRFAVATAEARDVDALCARLHVPSIVRDVALLSAAHRGALDAIDDGPPSADALVATMERCDAFRRPERFAQILDAQALRRAAGGASTTSALWASALDAARRVDAGAIAKANGYEPAAVAREVRAARVDAVAGVL